MSADEQVGVDERIALEAMTVAAEAFLEALAARDLDSVDECADAIEAARIAFRRAERKRRRDEKRELRQAVREFEPDLRALGDS